MGENDALEQVSKYFTESIEIYDNTFKDTELDNITRRDIVANTIVKFQEINIIANLELEKSAKNHSYVSPRDYLDFITHFNRIQNEKKNELISHQNHLMSGIKKIINTQSEVEIMRRELTKKDEEIKLKQQEQNKKLDEIHDKKTESEKL